MLSRVIPLLLALIFSVAQISTLLPGPPTSCAYGVIPFASSISSPQVHRCCCGETGSCCCDVKQEPAIAWPDMALTTLSGRDYNPAPRYGASDTDLQSLLISLHSKSFGRRTGAGPPLVSFYLVNLTFRC